MPVNLPALTAALFLQKSIHRSLQQKGHGWRGGSLGLEEYLRYLPLCAVKDYLPGKLVKRVRGKKLEETTVIG